MTYTSRDSTYMPLDGNDRLVVGNPHRIRFRIFGVELFPELQAWPITPRSAGKPSREIPTAALPGIVGHDAAVIEHITCIINSEDWNSEDSRRLAPACREIVVAMLRTISMNEHQPDTNREMRF